MSPKARPVSAVGDPSLGRLRRVLDEWRNSLLDMGGRNRLLNFRHTRTSTLEVTSPGVGALLADLAKGWEFAPVLQADAEDDRAGGAPPRAPPRRGPHENPPAAVAIARDQIRPKSRPMLKL
ncbi:DUF4011 domain-containing protein, partial [Streptomyces massasporeus]|uniref:DUF4011 domain-containing protein n=1 Tax=Streptomyces massasporeus TaxID=67324 RepID=UPI0036FAB5EF